MSTNNHDAAERLSRRLDALCSEDDFAGGLPVMEKYPVFESREITETERDLRDWGYVYGLAFGLALAANPKMSHEEAAELAFVPAQKALFAWGGEIMDPVVKRESVIRSLVWQFAQADAERERRWLKGEGHKIEMTPELHDALVDLTAYARG